jgi:hypothetical protein
MPNSDPTVDALNLADVAKTAALSLKDSYPAVVFTSGRRSVSQQAAAMAGNIVKSQNRNWITATYVQSAVRDACQKWVDDHPAATSVADLTSGLTSVLNTFTDAQLGQLSKHLAGMAFDVQPVDDDDGGDALKAAIKTLPALDKFLESEGGLTVWHAQFKG